MMYIKKSMVGIVFLPILAFAISACGGNVTPTSSTQTSVPDVSGTIQIDGSSTVFPIIEAVAEEFGIVTGGDVRVLVGISGTGGGFSKFCSGETDITNAYRPVKPSEVDACAEEEIDFVEIPVALDGLSVTVNLGNDFVDCLTVSQLETMWSPASEGIIDHWNQVRSDWPDERMTLYGPGVDSGTFDYFTEVVNGKSQSSRGDFIASENDNVLVQGVSGDENSIGYFGYSYYIENQDKLKAVGIDNGKGCVKPSGETINDGTYAPFSRPLFLYIRTDDVGRPAVREFMRFFLSETGSELVTDVGYLPLPEKTRRLALDRFETGKSGSIFGGDNPQRGPLDEVLTNN